MKIVKESKWQKATNLRGQSIMVKTIIEEDKKGIRYTRHIALVPKIK